MKDSVGNELPTGNDIVMTSFLLAVQVSMSVGNHVEYDKETKTAAITNKAGLTSFAQHL